MDRRSALKKTGWAAGAALATPSLLSLLQACRTQDRLSWTPEFLTEAEATNLAALADTLLPRTDTPGALDVKADVFLDKILAHAYSGEAREAFRGNFTAWNDRCREHHGAAFADLDAGEREAFLRTEEAAGGKYNPGVWGTAVGEQEPVSFYRGLKSMLVWAYTTSQEVGENVLSYDPIPGGYNGCIPLSDVGNRWSL